MVNSIIVVGLILLRQRHPCEMQSIRREKVYLAMVARERAIRVTQSMQCHVGGDAALAHILLWTCYLAVTLDSAGVRVLEHAIYGTASTLFR